MFNWWTFFFQIVNFVVVVYILYRVLFRPVRDMILKRRTEIERSRADIEKERSEAEALKKEFEEKLREVDTLRKTTLETARTEALKERERILSDTKADIEKEREKLRKLIEDERRRLYEEVKKKGIELSAELSGRILASIVDSTIDRILIHKTLDRLKSLSDSEKEEILSGTDSCTVRVGSAFPLDDETKKEITRIVEETFGCKTDSEFTVIPELIGGIMVRIGSRVFDGTIKGNIDRVVERLRG
ncbi:MAG TPA: hypothetical protein ENK09_11000 [Nitrospirae bacterium]|nr:hypothetical protein [Nitrospirota bacterium]